MLGSPPSTGRWNFGYWSSLVLFSAKGMRSSLFFAEWAIIGIASFGEWDIVGNFVSASWISLELLMASGLSFDLFLLASGISLELFFGEPRRAGYY